MSFFDWRRHVWRGFGRGLGPLLWLWLLRRARSGKEDRQRLHERWGFSAHHRPQGPLVWAHGASVGEVTALLPLLHQLSGLRPDLSFLLTSGTVTSAAVVARQDVPGLLHQYVPLDLPGPVDRFLAHWQPDLVLWSESDLWPGILRRLQSLGCPTLLLQARMSDRSARRWLRHPRVIRWLLDCFTCIVPQTEADAERFRRLGAADRLRPVCNLKLAAPPLPAEADEVARWQALIGRRPHWVMASSHPGDEAIAAAAHRALHGRFPDLLTMIVPRHPERGPDIAQGLAHEGLSVALRSRADEVFAGTDIYIADTLGELGLWYRINSLTLMGGSMIPHGGQNPMEPARLGSAVLFGPHMFNFSDMTAELLAAGAAREVADLASLITMLSNLLGDPDTAAAMGEAGKNHAADQQRALNEVRRTVEHYLPPATDRKDAAHDT